MRKPIRTETRATKTMKQPWYWKERKAWYVDDLVDGRIRLGKSKSEAYDQWRKLLDQYDRREEGDPTFSELSEAYCDFGLNQVRLGQIQRSTLDDYLSYIDWFSEEHGSMRVSELAPKHVTDWLANHPSWGVSGQRSAIKAVKRVLNWAELEGRISRNTLSSVEKPRYRRREGLISADVHQKMVGAARNGGNCCRADKQFGLILIALLHCGGRPQDVSRARVEHVDPDVTRWTLPEHKTRRYTDQPRTVFLSPCLRTITKMLMAGRTEGPLFRGRRGQVSTNAITLRVSRIKKKLNIETVAYLYRHTYITSAMERGVDTAAIAQLTGTSVTMIERHYGHLGTKHDHLAKAAARAVIRKH